VTSSQYPRPERALRSADIAEALPPGSGTAADQRLERMLGSDGERLDLAAVNWLLAADLPEFAGWTREAYFHQLNEMTRQVREEMARMQAVAVSRGERLEDARTRCAIFCNAVIKLKFAYKEEFRNETLTPASLRALYANPENICLAGLLRSRRGSCVSMPLLYLVLGQRLGMPVNLVTVGRHYFIRWEEAGYRMNIETTIVDRVCVTPDDEVYMELEGLKRQELQGSDLRNLSPREVVGNLLFARSGYWATKGPAHDPQRRHDLKWARQLAPEDAGIKAAYLASSLGRPGLRPGESTANRIEE